MKQMNLKNIILLILIMVYLISCSKDGTDSKTKTFILDGETEIIASVNGSNITKYDLDNTLRTMLGEGASKQFDEKGRKKILESLVKSRAIASAKEKQLNPKEMAILEKQVKSYREKILVQWYLVKNSPPEPVTDEMVKEYYESHPELYGAKTIKIYEMISGGAGIDRKARNALIKALGSAKGNKDWGKWVKKLNKKGYTVNYRRGRDSDRIMHSQIKKMIQKLNKGEVSNLSFIKGIVYLVRITDKKMINPRPLNEVKAEIKKTLMPIQLKKSIKEASEEVLKTAEVKYFIKKQ